MEMNIPSKKWKKSVPPGRILAIRLQAMGDTVITLPYLQHLRNTLPPGTRLDLLTRREVDTIPRNIRLFDKIYSIGGGRNFRKQLVLTFLLLPRLWFRRYEVVIDLQNNIISRLVRKCLLPQAWSEFDRWSPVPAGERTRLTIEAIGMGKCLASSAFDLKERHAGFDLLRANGWVPGYELVVLNPAGAFPSRNWENSKYVEFTLRWLQFRPATKFLIIGTDLISGRAAFLEKALAPHVINLVNKTSPFQAFAILQQTAFVLSEDSGLMHMAWVSGIPTLVLFGSTGSHRARPVGLHTSFIDSSDLECGNCMQELCKYGDTRCLNRYTAEMVFEKAASLVHSFPGQVHQSEP